jgi:hypothetical protein
MRLVSKGLLIYYLAAIPIALFILLQTAHIFLKFFEKGETYLWFADYLQYEYES